MTKNKTPATPEVKNLKEELSALLFWEPTGCHTASHEQTRLRLLDTWVSQNKKNAKQAFSSVNWKNDKLPDEATEWIVNLALKHPEFDIDLTKVLGSVYFDCIDKKVGFLILESMLRKITEKELKGALENASEFFGCQSFSDKDKDSTKNLIELIVLKAKKLNKLKDLESFASDLAGLPLEHAAPVLTKEPSVSDIVTVALSFQEVTKELKKTSPSSQKITEILKSVDKEHAKKLIKSEQDAAGTMLQTCLRADSPDRAFAYISALTALDPKDAFLFTPDTNSVLRFLMRSKIKEPVVTELVKYMPSQSLLKMAVDAASSAFVSSLSELSQVNSATKLLKALSKAGVPVKTKAFKPTVDDFECLLDDNPKKFFQNPKTQKAYEALSQELHPSFAGVLNTLSLAFGGPSLVAKEAPFAIGKDFAQSIKDYDREDWRREANILRSFVARQSKLSLTQAVALSTQKAPVQKAQRKL